MYYPMIILYGWVIVAEYYPSLISPPLVKGVLYPNTERAVQIHVIPSKIRKFKLYWKMLPVQNPPSSPTPTSDNENSTTFAPGNF